MLSINSYRFIFLFLFCIIHPHTIAGQEVGEVFEISDLKEEYIINKNLYILEDPDCNLPIEALNYNVYADQFLAFKTSQDLDHQYCYWIRFKLRSSPEVDHDFNDWKLFIGEGNYASVYIIDSLGNILDHKKSGNWYPRSQKVDKLNYSVQRVSVSFNPKDELTYYIRYQRKDYHPHVIDIKLRKYDFYQTTDYLFSTWQNWLFLGFLGSMILLNFLFFYSTKFHAYLYHGIFILGFFIFILDLYGVTFNLPFIDEHPFLVQLVDIFGVSIADFAYFQFVRYYLNLKLIFPKWDYVLRLIIKVKIVFWPSIVVFYYFSFNEPLTDRIILLFLLIEYSIIVFFLIFKLKPKERAAMFLIVGTSILLLLLIMDIFSLFRSAGISRSLSQIGLMGEIMAFSFGLSYRFNQLKEEEENAKKIKELSEFKSQLLTNITHEFRTPLTVIQGVSELFQESLAKKMDPYEIKKGNDAIQRNSRDLLNLVNQMLDLAKLESKILQIDLTSKDLVDIIKEAIYSLSREAERKNISTTFESEPSTLEMDVDEHKMHTILVNLISNSIKFTPDEGRIRVSLHTQKHKDGYQAIINVEDSGIGIDKKDLPHIFTKFYQAKTSNHEKFGTGIGLSLVKELTELMDGTVEVESELNKGTTFTINIPIKNEIKQKDKHQKQDDSIDEDILHGKFDLLDKKPVLLIVEDNEEIVDYLDRLLHKDYELVKAYDGIEGLKKAISVIPDLIISDLMMPKMNGIKMCISLKTDDKTNHIPIIILTAKSGFEHKLEGLETGADAYLTKPFRKEELLIRLRKLNESRLVLQKKYSQFALIENPIELKKENSFLHKVHSVIENNLNNPQFNVEELAKLLHMSRMQLHRKLTAISDRSASNYIRAYRLYRSKPLLSDFELTIGEISWEVGFNDVGYYSKSFQKEFGMTPSEYRHKIKDI